MRIFSLVAAFLLLCTFAIAEDVIVGTDENFHQLLVENPSGLLAEFYAPWCGHCKQLAPEYEKAATALKGKVPLVKVDCTVENELASEFKVEGYPTIKFFKDGKDIPYTGGRTAQEIINWVSKKSGPPATRVTSKTEINNAQAQSSSIALGLFKSEDSDEYKSFLEVAKEDSLEEVAFFESFDESVISSFGGKVPAVVILKTGESDTVTTDFSNLKKWVDFNAFPLVEAISQKSFQRLSAAKSYLVVTFLKDDPTSEESKAVLAIVTNVAKKHSEKFGFVYTPIEQHDISRFGLSTNNLPHAFVMSSDQSAQNNYPADQSKPLSEETLTSLLESIIEGTAVPHFNSEPIPEKDDGPVKTVVGLNFNDVVINNDKDVLLEVYAPWCGHCKNLAPIYEELARKLAKNPKVVIAKSDGTKNDLPVEVSGFPTIKFFPGDDKKNPIDYDGARTVDGFIAFLKQHSSFKAATSEEKDEL